MRPARQSGATVTSPGPWGPQRRLPAAGAESGWRRGTCPPHRLDGWWAGQQMGGRGKPGKGTVEGTQVSARPWWRLAAQRPRLVDALVRLVLGLGGPDWRC